MAKHPGFSLLELLVVIVIISLLAVFGHNEYLSYVERAKISEALSVLEEYQGIAYELHARTGNIQPYYVLFTDADQTGLVSGSPSSDSAVKQVNLKYISNVAAFSGTDGSGNTYILLGAELQPDGFITTGSDFVYIAGVQTPGGVLTWQCGTSTSQGNSVNAAYLPQSCQATLP